jgi:hypothetical protein
VVYLGLTGSSSISADWWFLRSRDDGDTFDLLEEGHFSLCGMAVYILQPDPVDPASVFRARSCVAGRNTSVPIEVSRDFGATFTTSFAAPLEFPAVLVGGQGAQPDRWYLASRRDSRAGGSTVFRSDDGAVSWDEALTFRQDPSPAGPVGSNVTLGGLAYDPANPDAVWVALTGDGDGVLASLDGGANWFDAGAHGLGVAQQLALGIDGENLYLATDQGLWRASLSAPQPQPEVPAEDVPAVDDSSRPQGK